MSQAKSAVPDFEDALAQLEKLVTRLEQGDLTLEDSLKDFETGINLTRTCQKGLDEAEQRVEQLIKKGDQYTLQAFEPESDD
ncbi:MAG: exodeoxyribonuclease VII small subunit [Gammaproteobacteria bacterium]|nr:MAG: exodeoxyribonuclease VII small subunit [Gammaproteobacteria bacterium]